ncbi:hypothetical protein GS18_0221305 [Metabacillus indicus]|uniref:Uncharacterized protein n=1 Tax=Metabacillus indicus TaxID=246786 RepID=A0A084GJ56_METID|nr:hypothetical protein GS18_0221305 [Metabacillus indicus]
MIFIFMKQTLIIQQMVALIEELSLKKWSEAHQPLTIFLCEYNCFFDGLIETHKTPVDCSGRNLTPAGYRGKGRPRRLAEEAPRPPRGKQVPGAKGNGYELHFQIVRKNDNQKKPHFRR